MLMLITETGIEENRKTLVTLMQFDRNIWEIRMVKDEARDVENRYVVED
jgi:hypothetical protein